MVPTPKGTREVQVRCREPGQTWSMLHALQFYERTGIFVANERTQLDLPFGGQRGVGSSSVANPNLDGPKRDICALVHMSYTAFEQQLLVSRELWERRRSFGGQP